MRRFYPWYVVGVLMLASMLSLLDRQILSLLVGPVRAQFGLDDGQIGLLLGLVFALAFALAGPPLAALVDRGHRRNLVIAALLFWSAALAGLALARDYGELLLARAALAAGEAALAPAAYSLIASYFPPGRTARANSVYGIGVYLGIGVAVLIGGLLTSMGARQGTLVLPWLGAVAPWQSVLLLLTLAGPLMALLLLTVREPPRTAAQAQARGDLRELWRQRRILLPLAPGFAMLSLSGYGAAAWLPSYFMRNHGWSAAQFGVAYGLVVVVAGIAGALLGGWLADRPRNRDGVEAPLRLSLIATVGGLLTGLLYLAPVDPWLAMLLLVPATVCIALPGALWPTALQRLLPIGVLGRAVALCLLAINLLGLGLGPTLVGAVNHRLFAQDQALNLSMLLVCGGAQLLALLLLRTAWRAARR